MTHLIPGEQESVTASSFWGRADHPHNLCPMGLRSAARQSRMPVLIYWATVRLAMTTAYGQRFGPQLADPSSVCWDFQAHTGKSPLLVPEQDRENSRSKSCGTPLFWCLFWNPSCLFLGLKAALNTLPDLAADRLPRGCRPPSKQHFRSIALILLHSPNICHINPFKQASDQTVAWLKKLAKKRTEP